MEVVGTYRRSGSHPSALKRSPDDLQMPHEVRNRCIYFTSTGNIISGAFICLFYMSIILQLAVEIKYKMSYNILIWA